MVETPSAARSVYPFGRCGEPVLLHRGAMTIDGEGVEGRIELRLLPTLSVHWTAYGGRRPLPGTSVKIEFRAAVGTTEVDAQCSFRGDASAGWIPHLEGGREQGALDHVVAH